MEEHHRAGGEGVPGPPAAAPGFFARSSSIVLWDLKKWFPDKDYVNVGFGGSVIRDSTHFAPRILTPHKPGTIIFYAGDNDIAQNRSPDQVLGDFRAFVAPPSARITRAAACSSFR